MPRKIDQTPEEAAREHERNYRRFYRAGGRMRQVSKDATDPERVVPSDSLAVLSDLDIANPDNLSRLRRGLFQHVLAGNLGQADASAALRFAEAEAAAAPRKASDAATRVMAQVIAEKPALDDD